MSTLNRRGFTLIELIMALSLGAVVAALVYQAIMSTQRATQAGTEAVDVRQNLRAGVGYLGTVVRELNAQEGDIITATATQFQFKSMRWTGFLCDVPSSIFVSAVTLPMSRNPLYGIRGPDVSQDSVFMFLDGDPTTRGDDAWLAGRATGMANGNCADGSPSVDVTVTLPGGAPPAATVMASLTVGSPVRGFQMEELTLLQTGGRWWMAQRTANGAGAWTTPRPLIGPLEAAGMALTYFDSSGTATATLTDIASLAVVLRGESRNRVHKAPVGSVDFARDSLISRIALRNNPRF
jgi:prepilin-type N-terminal cleavage/methylation domain-containing protein